MHCTNGIIIQGKMKMINQMKPQRRKTQNHLLKESLLLPVDIDITPYHQLQLIPPRQNTRNRMKHKYHQIILVKEGGFSFDSSSTTENI